MKKRIEDEVRDGLLSSNVVLPVLSNRISHGWEFLCRQVPGQEKPWLRFVEAALHWESSTFQAGETLLVARKYLLKDGKMVFGWFIRLSCKTHSRAAELSESFTKLLKDIHVETKIAPQQAVQVSQKAAPQRPGSPQLKVVSRRRTEEGVWEEQEMPLPHVTKDLNVPTKPVWNAAQGKFVGGYKGARTVGTGR